MFKTFPDSRSCNVSSTQPSLLKRHGCFSWLAPTDGRQLVQLLLEWYGKTCFIGQFLFKGLRLSYKKKRIVTESAELVTHLDLVNRSCLDSIDLGFWDSSLLFAKALQPLFFLYSLFVLQK